MERLSPRRLLSCDLAQALAAAALRLAREQGMSVAVAVVDASGQVKALLVDDLAPLVATELSQRKATTALLGLDSGTLGKALEGQPSLLQSFAAVPGVTLLAGGVPIRLDGQVAGALGVGGGTPEQDADIACAALEALGL